MMIHLQVSDNGYTISTQPYYNSNRFLFSDGYVDHPNQSYTWNIQPVNNQTNVYTISNAEGKTLAWDGSNTTVIIGDATSNANEQWQLIKVDTEDATTDNEVDVSHLLRNANLDQLGSNWAYAWTKTGGAAVQGIDGHNDRNTYYGKNLSIEIFNNQGGITQTVKNIPNGKYRVKCQGFYRAGAVDVANNAHDNNTEELNAYLFANDKETPLMSIFEEAGKNENGTSSSTNGKIPNWPSEANHYFDADLYTNTLQDVIVYNETLTLGIKKEKIISNDWTYFDNFQLFYIGDAKDEVAANQYKALKNEAIELLQNEAANVIGKEAKDLQTIIDNTEAVTSANIADKKDEINKAMDIVKAAKDAYNDYATQIANAKVLGINTETFESYLKDNNNITASSVRTKIQELNVLTDQTINEKNYKDIATPIKATYSTWGRSTNFVSDMKDQSWAGHDSTEPKGLYHEVSNGYWVGPWNHNISKEIELGAGSYVLKIACRSSEKGHGIISVSDATSILGTAIFPQNGDEGKGIDLKGLANFEGENSEFSNDESKGKYGRGWQWRFIPFTLSNATKITMKVEVSVEEQYNYPGFCDPQLLAIANAVTLNETENYSIKAPTYANITLNRKLKKDKWNTIVLPFALSSDETKSTFGEDVQIAEYTGSTKENETITLNFSNTTDGIKANVPYMIKPTEDGTSYSANEVILETTTDAIVNDTEDGNDIKFVGNYNANAKLEAGNYFISNNYFYQANGNESVKAYRAYFTAPSEAAEAKVLNISINGGTITGINEVNSVNPATSYDIYSINGMLVKKSATSLEGLAKGVYIVNGKKYIAK